MIDVDVDLPWNCWASVTDDPNGSLNHLIIFIETGNRIIVITADGNSFRLR